MVTSQTNSPEALVSPSRAERERLLQRVVESAPFRRASRLREFLIYVGNEVILHGTEDLHEQQIGVAVFGRSPSYDTSQDNIVRVNATELRKRIDLFFSTEGQDEPVVFEIPRGRYAPIFSSRRLDAFDRLVEESSLTEKVPTPVSAANDQPTSLDAVAPQASARWFENPTQGVLLVIIVCLAAWALAETLRNRQDQASIHKWQSKPGLRAFWGNFFGKGLPPEIVLGDTAFVFAQDALHRQFSLANYLDYSYRTTQSLDAMSNDARNQEQKDLALLFARSSGSIGDFRVARRITELEPADADTRLLFAREYAGHRLRWNNSIFIGSSRSNPWVELFDDQMAYHFKGIGGQPPSVVTVDKPTGKEQAEYLLPSDPSERIAYCVIVFLPNPTNTGSTLILAGTDSQATEAGGDFMTSEEHLRELQQIFQQKTFPHFQVLLRISRYNGTPLGTEIISYRVSKQ